MKGHAVITSEEAKRITKGHTPLVPVEYEQACKALDACCTLDEAKYWSDKADALSAWAKIYRNDDALRKAKALKLYAYRRMGELAIELRPLRGKPGTGNGGPRSLLRENGLQDNRAKAAVKMAELPQRAFDKLLNAPRLISPLTASLTDWERILHSSGFYMLRSFTRRYSAKELAARMTIKQKKDAKEIVAAITEWLDEFDQYL